LGNTRYITNEAGSVVKSYFYTPFGQIHTQSGSLNQPYQYVGGEFYYSDEGAGLKLLGQRWYDGGVGRFISRDPIGEEGGLNLYAYVGNNCVNFIDSEGKRRNSRDINPICYIMCYFTFMDSLEESYCNCKDFMENFSGWICKAGCGVWCFLNRYRYIDISECFKNCDDLCGAGASSICNVIFIAGVIEADRYCGRLCQKKNGIY